MPNEADVLAEIKKKFALQEADGKFANEEIPPHIQMAFHNCLISHPDGVTVLHELGKRLHFFESGYSMVELMERNVFLSILTMCGVQSDDIAKAIISIVKEKTSGA